MLHFKFIFIYFDMKFDGKISKNWKMGIFEANFNDFEVYRKSVAKKTPY